MDRQPRPPIRYTSIHTPVPYVHYDVGDDATPMFAVPPGEYVVIHAARLLDDIRAWTGVATSLRAFGHRPILSVSASALELAHRGVENAGWLRGVRIVGDPSMLDIAVIAAKLRAKPSHRWSRRDERIWTDAVKRGGLSSTEYAALCRPMWWGTWRTEHVTLDTVRRLRAAAA